MKNKKPWTRKEKLILFMIFVTLLIGILGFIIKINIDINYMQDEIEHLKIDNAEIKNLVTTNITTTNYLCYNKNCTTYSHFNGSSLIIKVN